MNRQKIHRLVFIALMTAVICAVSPFTVPIGAVPVSMTILAIFFALYVLGMKSGLISCLLYILIGFIGVPVFSGFGSGAAKVLGPTGGYILGYIFLALIAGFFIDRFPENRLIPFFGMLAGVVVCYAFGTAWLMYQAHMTLSQALLAGVIPFIPFDLLKAAIAALAGPKIRKAVAKAKQ